MFKNEKKFSDKRYDDFNQIVSNEVQRKLETVKNRFSLQLKESILDQDGQGA